MELYEDEKHLSIKITLEEYFFFFLSLPMMNDFISCIDRGELEWVFLINDDR